VYLSTYFPEVIVHVSSIYYHAIIRTEKEMNEWVKAINDAIMDNIRKRTCRTPYQELEESVNFGKVVS